MFILAFLSQGRYIDLVDITDDLRVTVGGTKCNVTKIGYNIVICAPERPAVFTDNEPKKSVVVSATKMYINQEYDYD